MKRCWLILSLILVLAVLPAGCAAPGSEEPSASGAQSGGSGTSGETSGPVETVEPYPYGGPFTPDEEAQQAADFAAALLSGGLRWELPPFRSFAELQNEHADVILRLLAAHEGDMIRAGGRVADLTTLPGYDANEAAQAASGARYYTLDAASAVLRTLFGPDETPDWAAMAEQLPGQVLSVTGAVCIQPLEQARAETLALPVGYAAEDGGWTLQFAVAVRMNDSDGWLDYTSGEALGQPDADEPMDEFLTRQLPSLGLITATVRKNADGSLRLDRLEGTYTVGTTGAAE